MLRTRLAESSFSTVRCDLHAPALAESVQVPHPPGTAAVHRGGGLEFNRNKKKHKSEQLSVVQFKNQR